MTNKYIFEFDNVHKSFGRQKVLRGFDLKVPKGKISYIIGRSGEGKSVTLKTVVGILKPDMGNVTLLGQQMPQIESKEWFEVRKRLGLLFQDGALFDSLSVFENVAFPLLEHTKFSRAEIRFRVDEVLEMVGLTGLDRKMPYDLSIGEKKRVGLARALALKPELMMYDEPTTGMDPIVSDLIDNLIVALQKRMPELTSVVISHDVSSILKVPDVIFLLHSGRLYLEGTPRDFMCTKDPVVVQFLSGSVEGPLATPIV